MSHASTNQAASAEEPRQERPWLNLTELPPISPALIVLVLLTADGRDDIHGPDVHRLGAGD